MVPKRKNVPADARAGMEPEIEALRELLRQALELASQQGDEGQAQALARRLEVLESLSLTAGRIGRLQVTLRSLGDDGLFGEALREAMDRAVRKLSELDGPGGEHGRG